MRDNKRTLRLDYKNGVEVGTEGESTRGEHCYRTDGLAKGSSSYHVRLLERAGLVKVVRTRKVRGVTERYYAMAARAIVLPDRGEGGPDVLMRHAVADLEAAPVDGERHVRMAHLRLTEEQFAELAVRLEVLADEYRELSDPSLPDASLVFALFHPAPPEQAEGGAK